MPDDLIRYDILAQDALRGVVRKVLSEVSRTGLPGQHHFFISFATRAPGVRISSRLLEQHPDEMTIVLQNQFWDLSVSEHSFEVGLSFDGVSERVLVPFAALRGFFDPSVQFGLQFETVARPDVGETKPGEQDAPDEALAAAAEPAEPPAAGDTEAEEGHDDQPDAADVVSLDAFRKK